MKLSQSHLGYIFLFTYSSFCNFYTNKIVCSLPGYLIHPLSTPHYCDAPDLTTRLTGDYRDQTYTGWHGPASLDALQVKEVMLESA